MTNKKEHSEIIKEIQERFRFVLLVAIFLYTVMSKLFDLYTAERAGEFSTAYAGFIALYFFIYFLFEISKNKLSFIWLKRINLLALITIGIFILPILLFALANKIPELFLMPVLKFSIWGIMIMPLLLTAIISLAFQFKENKRKTK